MKLLYKSILFSIGSILVLSSCDLDKSPYGNSTFWSSKEEIKLGLDGAYEPFYHEEGYGRGHWWAGPASDDMTINRDKPADAAITEFTIAGNTNSSSGQAQNWQLMYEVIRRSNDVMRHTTPDIEMTDFDRDVILGEANFLCAYAYFYLAKRYGGLPFYDYKDPNNINKPRETKTQTYKNIETYLQTAITHFENQNLWVREKVSGDENAWGRPNLGAAYGLLAKVYAHWGKYSEAKIAAEKVINSGYYSLDKTNNNGFAHLFSLAGEKNSEVLFNLTNKPIRQQGTVTSVICLAGNMSGGTGWHYFAPTKSLFDAYEAGDLRREVTVKTVGDTISYPPYIKMLQKEENELAKKEGRPAKTITAPQPIRTNDISDMKTGYMCAKYLAAYNDLDGWNWETGQDIPLLRYSDVLLIHAEAIVVLGGGSPTNPDVGVSAAASSFNEVRVRAFGGNMAKAIASPTFDDLVKERRCELAYEDERHYDLVRWGLAKKVYGAATTATDPRGARNFDPVKNAHFALPQIEIDDSRGVLANNPLPGYSSF